MPGNIFKKMAGTTVWGSIASVYELLEDVVKDVTNTAPSKKDFKDLQATVDGIKANEGVIKALLSIYTRNMSDLKSKIEGGGSATGSTVTSDVGMAKAGGVGGSAMTFASSSARLDTHMVFMLFAYENLCLMNIFFFA